MQVFPGGAVALFMAGSPCLSPVRIEGFIQAFPQRFQAGGGISSHTLFLKKIRQDVILEENRLILTV